MHKKREVFSANLKKFVDISIKNVEELLADDKRSFFISQKSGNRYGFINSNILKISSTCNDDMMDVDHSGNYQFISMFNDNFNNN